MAEMTYLRSPRLWLLSTAALIFGSQFSASAQIAPNYHAGAPTMVAAAPSLPTISPEQIARDVISEFNPRTGQQDLIAAPFDPFEEDPTLAASLRLRSADGAVAIDGYPLHDGALVEIDFYYNSPSDDPYGGRNYGEAAFVNGDLAPVVKRDTRIIECSTRVENVVYEQASYYGGGYSTGFYRPYRHYAGHSAFGFGFGNSYFGPGYSFFDSSRISFNLNSFGGRSFIPSRSFGGRSFGSRSFGSRSIPNRSNRRNRIVNTDRDRDEAGRARRNFDSERAENRDADNRDRETRRRRRNARRLSASDFEERANRIQTFDTGRNRSDVRRNLRNSAIRPSFNAQPRVSVAPAAAQPAPAQSSAAQPATAPASAAPSSQTQSNRRETRRSQPRRTDSNRSSARRDSANRNNSRRSETRSSSSRSRSNQVKKSSQRRRNSPNGNKRKLNFFPDTGHGGRSVVTSHSVDCAREDKLTVFIPKARLDAARFDGLTLVALDAQGGEAPIYLPPNYIEGFRLAATGQVRPQGLSAGPQPHAPSISNPVFRNGIEAAACPTGTSKQPDGTCLQSGEFGYPR